MVSEQSPSAAMLDFIVPLGPSMASRDQLVRETVDRLLKQSQGGSYTERRDEIRLPFRDLVRVTPVLRDGSLVTTQSQVVVGKHISQVGFGFFHRDPMPHRRVVVEFEQEHAPPISLLMQLFWCRFLREGWYDSGGRFERVVLLPSDSEECCDDLKKFAK